MSIFMLWQPMQVLAEQTWTPEELRINGINIYTPDQAIVSSQEGESSCRSAYMPTINDEDALGQAIDNYIRSNGGKGSPFDGLGTKIVQGSVRANINPFMPVIIARKESSFGTNGHATKGIFNAFGLTGDVKIAGSNHSWHAYSSWEESVYSTTSEEDFPQFMRRAYIEKRKLTTIEQIIPTYAPAFENNTDLYIQQLNEWMDELIAEAGSALTCESNQTVDGENIPDNPSENVKLGMKLAAEAGLDQAEQKCLYNLWQGESNWRNVTSKIPTRYGFAVGIPQSLPDLYENAADSRYRWAPDYRTNVESQIKWGLNYIKLRYGTPCRAYGFKEQSRKRKGNYGAYY